LENSRIELLICQKTLIVSFVKNWPLVGRMVDYGKKGEFLKSLINFSWNNSLYVSTSVFDLEIGNWGWFAKTNQVVAKNDPNMPNLSFICIDVALLLVAFCCVGINHQKGGRLKGKCALGPFLSILVIECQHKWTYVNLCIVMDKVQIK
jgi:hypothetical protein